MVTLHLQSRAPPFYPTLPSVDDNNYLGIMRRNFLPSFRKKLLKSLGPSSLVWLPTCLRLPTQ